LAELNVSPRSFDRTGNTLYASKELRFDKPDSRPIITPIFGMDNREVGVLDHIAEAATGLNEIYRILDEPEPKKLSGEGGPIERKAPARFPLSKLVDDAKKQQIFNNDIERQVGKLSGPSIFFMEYRGKRYPTEKERNFMLHTEHTFSEIPCLPITPNIAKAIIEGSQPFEKYLSFIKDSIEWLKKYRKKPIMAIVVNFGFLKLEKLIKLYVDQDINAFCIDFDCKTPVSHRSAIAECYRILDEYKRTETSFFYATNVNQGRFIHNKAVVNAKDILAFGFGLDAMGRRHRSKFPSKEMREKLGARWKPLDRKENKARLFIKSEYGYYKIQNVGDIDNYPLDSMIPRIAFSNTPLDSPQLKHYEKIFNMEQLGLEASTLRQIIDKENPLEYLGHKNHVDVKDVQQIKKFKINVEHPQTTLDEVL
jgi:hypothetical protein